ncbi:thioredoxin family protein [Polyangium jinanense]|uniref:Thioredoxin family protein n=1 Tax=Polyangium jinanense TaxID=2829994 RepID=A0A9X3X7D0_9BACT|nr:thioredoxin family protein [Polyangium jinanense]MDC3956645.1 thioredoxin family protein [Polyangium jinanense]MDC3985572.1 thioredoxin family protein [Polyangium jinanense]
MARPRTWIPALLFALAAGCGTAPPPGPDAPTDEAVRTNGAAGTNGTKSGEPTKPDGAAAGKDAAAAPLVFIEDDLDGAMARARAEKKALFVDAWAPWCHTCLSMKNYVLVDPALRPLADRVVFAAIDTDRPSSAAFLERYKMTFWPTFFVIDPAKGDVVAYWPGAASAREMRSFVEDAVRVMDASAPPSDPLYTLSQASAARAAGDHRKALALYDELLAKVDARWPRRDDALAGKLSALAGSGDVDGCARFGTAHVDEIRGAAAPADFASVLLSCASRLAKSPTQEQARRKAMARLEALVASPPPESTVDDRADALAILAGVKSELGDAEGARAAHEKRLVLMEKAAAEAKTPEIAATYDYGRAISYVALGRGEEAVRMLEQREREMPKSYDPPARLSSVLAKMGRFDAALAANGRAVALSYGPRRLAYLKQRADLQAKMGDKQGQIATLREEVAGHEALGPGQRNEAALADARHRLEEALGKGSAAPKR